MIKVSNPKIAELEKQLEAEKAKELAERRTRLWGLVKDLPAEELRLLGYLIHVHFHGDGEDD